MSRFREQRRTARRTNPLGVGTPADSERRLHLVFSADEIAAMSGLRRAALDVILATLAREAGPAFLQEHAAAIRDELAWIGAAPPRLLMQGFSPERLRARERQRRALRVVPPIASTTTTIRCAAVAPGDDLFEDVDKEDYAAVLTWAPPEAFRDK